MELVFIVTNRFDPSEVRVFSNRDSVRKYAIEEIKLHHNDLEWFETHPFSGQPEPMGRRHTVQIAQLL